MVGVTSVVPPSVVPSPDPVPSPFVPFADGTNGTAKSAVSTGDESPIGTMLALAAASVLAGGYVLIRRRKKEM